MNTCCFLGHRTINQTEELKQRLFKNIEFLIINNKVDTFLFGSKSQFNDLALEVVTTLKTKYSFINRVYVRAEFPFIDDNYKKYLLNKYDETYFPEKILNSGKATYIERNYEMINKSNICIIYYNEKNLPTNRKSGTKIAYNYALKQNKNIINVF